MTISEMPPPSRLEMERLLEEMYPGTSEPIRVCREQVLEFSTTITARNCLLSGPTGVGKSGLARAIGYFRRMMPLSESAARQEGKRLKFDAAGRIDIRLMDWYREMSLTGLVDEIAAAQLFGTVKGAFTGAENRAGIFEQASGTGFTKQTRGQLVTNGIVFLDEIGDLPAALQPTLLPVLAGTVFYRIGAEGTARREIEYRGVTVTATCLRLEETLRPDLLSRISAYTIRVPNLADCASDLPALFDRIESEILNRNRTEIERLRIVEPDSDGGYWTARHDTLRPLSAAARRRLSDVDWSQHGNLRGLSQAVERIISGRQVGEVVESLQIVGVASSMSLPDPDLFLQTLMRRPANGQGLGSHVRALELEQREALSSLLSDRPAARDALATALAIHPTRLTYQARQLPRTRRLVPEGGEE